MMILGSTQPPLLTLPSPFPLCEEHPHLEYFPFCLQTRQKKHCLIISSLTLQILELENKKTINNHCWRKRGRWCGGLSTWCTISSPQPDLEKKKLKPTRIAPPYTITTRSEKKKPKIEALLAK